MSERADFFQDIREGGHLPENMDFDEIAELIEENQEWQCDFCQIQACDTCDIANPNGSR